MGKQDTVVVFIGRSHSGWFSNDIEAANIEEVVVGVMGFEKLMHNDGLHVDGCPIQLGFVLGGGDENSVDVVGR